MLMIGVCPCGVLSMVIVSISKRLNGSKANESVFIEMSQLKTAMPYLVPVNVTEVVLTKTPRTSLFRKRVPLGRVKLIEFVFVLQARLSLLT